MTTTRSKSSPQAIRQAKKEEIAAKALELLRSPHLFGHYLEAIERSGVVGEERNAEVLLIVGVSRVLQKPINLIIKAPSSAGKNHLASRGLRLFPTDAVRELTSSSALAWNYSADDFRHRIVYLQERNDASGAIHPARLLISEDKLIRKVTVGSGRNRTTQDFVAEGPIASVSTTTKNQLEIDDETRHISIWMDASQAQSRRVVRSAVKEIKPLSQDELGIWRKAHRMLEGRARIPIKLPGWMDEVGERVYVGDIRVRRYFPAFVTACQTVALMRSFQKSRQLPESVEVDFADFWITTILFESVFVESIHRGSDASLETRCAVEKIVKRKGRGAAVEDLMNEWSMTEGKAYARLREAVKAGTIRRSNKPQKGNKKLFRPMPQPRFLPDPEEFFRQTPGVGDRLNFVHPLNGEWVIMTR